VTGKDVAPTIYMLAGGSGKRRMRADATLREGYSWSTFTIFSAECSLEEKIRSEGGEWRAGMAVRIVDVDVVDVDRSVGHQTLKQIDRINENYGHAGPAFVRALVNAGLHRQAEALRDRVSRAARELAGEGADSAKLRAATIFALLLIAGELAKAFGLIPRNAAVQNAVTWAWNRFRNSGDALALDPEEQSLAHLRQFIAERWDVTIKHCGDSISLSRERVAWYDDKIIYIPKARMFEATGRVLKASNIGAMLSRRGMLARQPEKDRYTVRYVPKVGRVECYAIRRDEFFTDPVADTDSACKEAADD
jgi:hypothetical protein